MAKPISSLHYFAIGMFTFSVQTVTKQTLISACGVSCLAAVGFLASGCAGSPTQAEASIPKQTKALRGADNLLVVDCLLPGLQPAKTTAQDCQLGGGEYVLHGDRNAALRVWLPQAEKGDKIAQTYVGEIYEKGLGATPDYARAAQWYRKAVEQGYARAQVNLGFLYEKGLGVPKDPETALKWYRQASGLGEAAVPELGRATELQRLRQEIEQRTKQTGQTQQQLDKIRKELEKLKSSDSTRGS